MAKKQRKLELTKRENQIMSALYREGSSTIAQISSRIANPPSDTALRTLLRILEVKGYVRSRKDGRTNVYTPAIDREVAAAPALRHVVDTFFGGSLSGAVAAHMADPDAEIDPEDLARLAQMVAESRRRGD